MKNGKLKLDGFVVSWHTSEREFCDSPLGSHARELVHNGLYRSYSTDPVTFSGRRFSCAVFFEDGVIRSVHLAPASDRASEWSEVSAEMLRKWKQDNDQWLRDAWGIQAPMEFPWGRIESTFDEKSWAADIIVSFK